MIANVAAATVGVPGAQLEALAAQYRASFGWETRWSGPLPDSLRRAWWLTGERRAVVLAAPGETRGMLRFVESAVPVPPALETTGWSAIEIAVRDVDALRSRLGPDSGFTVNGEPADLVVRDRPPTERAMQVIGPAGEQLYCLQVLEQSMSRPLAIPRDEALVGPVFIAVLAVHDFERAVVFYRDVLGLREYVNVQARLRTVNRQRRQPAGTTYPLAGLHSRGDSGVEIDGYPAEAPARTRLPGELPGGFCLASLFVDDLDAAVEATTAAGCTVSEPYQCDQPPYASRPAVLVNRPGGELLELIEAPEAS